MYAGTCEINTYNNYIQRCAYDFFSNAYIGGNNFLTDSRRCG